MLHLFKPNSYPAGFMHGVGIQQPQSSWKFFQMLRGANGQRLHDGFVEWIEKKNNPGIGWYLKLACFLQTDVNFGTPATFMGFSIRDA